MSKEEAAFQRIFTEGVTASQAGNADLAIERYSEALKLRPTCYSCQYNLGLSYSGKKDIAKAEEAFLAATKLKADAAEPYNQLANLYNEKKDFAKASEMAAEASKRSSSAPGGGGADMFFNQGVVLMNAQKMPEARAAFEAAVKAKPDYSEAWYLLASAYTNQGQFKEAVEAYESYLKHAPSTEKPEKLAGAKSNIAALKPLIK
jgi:tetratricopeptide (TPR) repeat protein